MFHRARKSRTGPDPRLRFIVIMVLMGIGWLLTDTRPALAYIDPILPGLIYQIGYFLVYGLLGVFAFFKPIKRLFMRHKEKDSHDPDA